MTTLAQISCRAAAGTPSPASTGVFILDAVSDILWANRAGERLLGNGRPFVLIERELRGADEPASRALRSAIASASESGSEAGAPPSLLWLPDGRSKLAVRLHAAANLNGLCEALPSARLALVAWNPWETPHLDGHVLRDLFRLTPREAELALALAFGSNPRQAAAELQISTETARTYLRRIFRKTGVSRRADLVRLVVSNCRPLP